GRRRADGKGQLVAVHVLTDDGAIDRRVLVGGERRAGGSRRIVDRRHRHRDVHGGGAAIAVVDDDGEAVIAVEIVVRGVGVLAGLRIQHEGAVGWRRGHRVGQLVAVDIIAGDGAGDGRVFVGGQRLAGGGRRIVHHHHRDGHLGRRGPAVAVVDDDGEAVVA